VPLPEPQGARLTYYCDLIVFGPPGSTDEMGRFAKDVGTSEKEFLIAPLPASYKGEIVW